jgi:hypothetical protein
VIVKKIPPSKAAAPKSRAANIRALIDYIAGVGTGEKVEHRGSANPLNVDHSGQVDEMIDLAEVAWRSPQPVQHWILSWREGEQPTAAHADDAVQAFLAEMGLAGHQAIYALHRDTHNWHLHLAVNRVNPDTEALATVNNRFDHEIAQRAIARIERRQGWEPEEHALYRVRPDGQVDRSRSRADTERKPSVGALDFEERAGERSAERIAIEEIAPAIRGPRSWAALHQALRDKGVRFERKGSGALLWIGDRPVKASAAGRDCSMVALCKRLGEFEPARALGPTAVDRPAPIRPGDQLLASYVEQRRAHYSVGQAHRTKLAERQREEWRRLVAQARRTRTQILDRSWRGRGPLLNATRSMLAAQQAREKAALRDRHRLERAAPYRGKGRFPSYEEWLQERDPDRAQEWRHREREPARIEGPTFERSAPRDIRAFAGIVDGWRVHYRRVGERGSPAFTDRGKEIDIYDSTRRESVLAALQLSAQKWGAFMVRGSDRFKRMCVELAAEHGFNLANPELQEAIAAERQRIRSLERERAMGRERRAPASPDTRSPVEVYRLHLTEVARERPGKPLHPSRLDAEIAVRMRVSGHSPEEIARAIKEAARAARPHERRDWDAYANRTVAVAFGVQGDRRVEDLRRHDEQSRRIEGRYRDDTERLPPGRGRSRSGQER